MPGGWKNPHLESSLGKPQKPFLNPVHDTTCGVVLLTTVCDALQGPTSLKGIGGRLDMVLGQEKEIDLTNADEAAEGCAQQ